MPAVPAAAGSQEVATTGGGRRLGTNLLISGAAGAIVTAVLLGIIPFSRSFGLISFALAGFLGGVARGVDKAALGLVHRGNREGLGADAVGDI